MDKLIDKYVNIVGDDWMLVFIFKNKEEESDSGFRTLALQEMIKRGVLFQGIFVPCYSHSIDEIEKFVYAFKETLSIYKKALEEGHNKYLVGRPTKSVFRKIL